MGLILFVNANSDSTLQAINSRKENAKLQNFLAKIERQVLYRE
jgi:hypothetical protein